MKKNLNITINTDIYLDGEPKIHLPDFQFEKEVILVKEELPIEKGENVEKKGDKNPLIEAHVGMTYSEIEKRMIITTLIYYQCDLAMTAKILGICEKTLYNKMILYKIKIDKHPQ